LIEHRSEGIRDEHVSRARVPERVENYLKVVFLKNPLRVTTHLGGSQCLGFGIERENAEVQCLSVVQDSDLGAFSGRRTLVGFLLDEHVNQCSALPDYIF